MSNSKSVLENLLNEFFIALGRNAELIKQQAFQTDAQKQSLRKRITLILD